jgi:hypothetical protein
LQRRREPNPKVSKEKKQRNQKKLNYTHKKTQLFFCNGNGNGGGAHKSLGASSTRLIMDEVE